MHIRGLYGPDFSGPGPARMIAISARTELKIKISAQAWPSPEEKLKFRHEFSPARKRDWNFNLSQNRLVACRLKAKCPLVGTWPIGDVASVGVFLRDPNSYLLKFLKKPRKIPNG